MFLRLGLQHGPIFIHALGDGFFCGRMHTPVNRLPLIGPLVAVVGALNDRPQADDPLSKGKTVITDLAPELIEVGRVLSGTYNIEVPPTCAEQLAMRKAVNG
jgi:hypothetical protein